MKWFCSGVPLGRHLGFEFGVLPRDKEQGKFKIKFESRFKGKGWRP